MSPVVIDRVLGSVPVAGAFAGLTRSRLRVLAYHGVEDPAAFDRQVDHLVEHWHPITSAQVVEACAGGADLPDRAVWLTFDDGLRSAVVDGRTVLDRHGVRATAFVNPGAIGRCQWWQLIEEADGREAVSATKVLDDDDRRALVARAEAAIPPDVKAGLAEQVATLAELRAWIAAGHTVGNHTWDHPCLDRCRVDVQLDQVDRGRHALLEAGLMRQPLFAYPNGDWTAPVDHHLRAGDHALAVLFDHRLASLDDPFMISRVRVDASASLSRFRAIVSGVHPTVMHIRDRLVPRGQRA